MTLLDLMATPPDRKPLIFEPPEFLDVPLVPNEKEVFNDIVEKEFKGAKDTVTMSDEMDTEPKEQAKKIWGQASGRFVATPACGQSSERSAQTQENKEKGGAVRCSVKEKAC